MKKIIPLTFLIALTFSVFSQAYKPMLKENKTWETHNWNGIWPPSGPPSDDCALWFLNGDSTVKGNIYYKLHSHDTTIFWGDPVAFPANSNFSGILLREDTVTRKIWGLGLGYATFDSTETIVYDFSLNVGDTMASARKFGNLITTTTPPYYDYEDYHAIIDSINFILLNNGDSTRAFYLSPIDFGVLANPFYVMEGIGSRIGFHYPFEVEFENDLDLTCVDDNNISLYGVNCGVILGINKPEQSNSFKISPNPNNGENIVVSGKEINTIKIFNLQGQLVKEVETKKKVETTINLENQPKGIYFVKALFKNGNVVTEKLVIQ
ncbi:T9SS type A sorting domain-containing protein [Vicingaceae bacterium]|nr:T9SS type A sorting domain-containing protein [Vicingaceae bacterium]